EKSRTRPSGQASWRTKSRRQQESEESAALTACGPLRNSPDRGHASFWEGAWESRSRRAATGRSSSWMACARPSPSRAAPVGPGGRGGPVWAAEWGRFAVSGLLARPEFQPAHVDEVVLGNCGTPADAANIGRVVSLAAGIPRPVPAFTVHRNCASGLEAIAQA